MRFFHALRHFGREAVVGLARSWRVSLLAVLTIAVSLFLAGAFLLASRNLARSIAAWREAARLVVYLDSRSGDAGREEVGQRLADSGWVAELEYVSPSDGAERFRDTFPSLSELVDDQRYAALPAAYEARLGELATTDRERFEAWLAELARSPAVETVDDDRDWIEDVETLLAIVRTVGALLSGVLLGAAVFTIAAVVRLTSFLYRDEIAVMRLVGATEFFIRGPFYVEGLLQGLLGAVAAVLALAATHAAIAPQLEASLVLAIAAREFLRPQEILLLVAFGALAGLIGAVVSLGRERPASERH